MSSAIREAGVESAGPTGADSGIQVEFICSKLVAFLLDVRYHLHQINLG